jgi:hypothetical protein
MLFAPAFTFARWRSTSGRLFVPPSLRTARHLLNGFCSLSCDSQAHPRALRPRTPVEYRAGTCPGGHAPAEGPDSRFHPRGMASPSPKRPGHSSSSAGVDAGWETRQRSIPSDPGLASTRPPRRGARLFETECLPPTTVPSWVSDPSNARPALRTAFYCRASASPFVTCPRRRP